MLKAGFVSSSEFWHWERQFPRGETVWDGVQFVFEGDFESCDVLFVYDGIRENLCRRLKARRVAFIAGEPIFVKQYHNDFLGQFDLVLTTDRSTRHPNVDFGQVALPWHVGAWDESSQLLENPMGYDELAAWRPQKSKTMSVVSSNKAFTLGHRSRLDFVEKLANYFGNEIDIFGRNINGFGDKIEVLKDYTYHIALENCVSTDYWTEKLSDPFLAGAYPIYHGCPNVHDYFSENALTCININDPTSAIQTIRRTIESDVAATATQYLDDAKQKVLNEHNLFQVLSNLAKRLCTAQLRVYRTKCLASEKFYSKYKSPLYRQFRRTTRLMGDFVGI